MADTNSPESQELLRRFPDMKPLKSSPTLFTLNGFGVAMYGKRDPDFETNTYVKTQCLCFIFIPVLAVGAFRVADAERGWYFIGRVPLSTFAATWNKLAALLMVLLVSSIAWNVHTGSPGYQAKQRLNEGRKLMGAGSYVRAAGIFRDLAMGPTERETARLELQKALEAGLSAGGDAAVSSYQLLGSLPARYVTTEPIIPQPLERGLKLAAEVGKQNPADGLLVLAATEKFAPTNELVLKLQQDLLIAGTVKEPGNLKYLEPLAIRYEAQDQAEQCVLLLEPHKTKLGQSECARILGQQFMAQNRYNDAYDLLYPYVQGRIASLVSAEQVYTNATEHSYKAAIKVLNDGQADSRFYDKYDKANKADQEEMVDDYAHDFMQKDPNYQRAISQFREANRIVPVVLDLGIVQLNRAQELADPAARKTELEAAEKTFLAIRGSAGESDEYRMFLGQVYYWLGRADEGKTLFDALLVSRQRSVPILINLAGVYRDVGDDHHARELFEEAYRKATDDQMRHKIASSRAHVQKDLDDHIDWLQKSDTTETYVKIGLSGAKARKALSSGNRAEAAQQLREVVGMYAKQPRTAPTLNNWGLAQLNLFEASGNLADYRRGVELMEESIAMDPGNSILIRNITPILMDEGLMEISGDRFKFVELGEPPGLGIISSLYRDEAGLKQLMERLNATEAMKRGLGYLDRALVLSPKSVYLYQTQLLLASHTRDLAGMKKVQQRIQAAQLDLSQENKEALENLTSEKSAELLVDMQNELKRLDGLIRDNGQNAHAATRAYLENRRVMQLQGMHVMGQKQELATLLEQAKKNHAVLDSYASLMQVANLHMLLAGEELARANAEYAALQKEQQRILSGRELCTLLLERGGPLAEMIRNNANLKAVVEIEKERIRRLPSYPAPSRWSLLRHFDAPLAESVRQSYLADELARLDVELDGQLSPMDASSVLEVYWSHLMAGRITEATAAYQAALNRGLPLPKLVKQKI